jgi:hypothetical protein
VNYVPGPVGPVDAAGRAPTTGVQRAPAIAVPAGGLIPVRAATLKKPAGKRVRPKYTPPDVGGPTALLSDSALTTHVAPPGWRARLYQLPQDPSQELVCSPFTYQLQEPPPGHCGGDRQSPAEEAQGSEPELPEPHSRPRRPGSSGPASAHCCRPPATLGR